MRRVVVTGLGAVTPLGNDAPSTWRAAVEGRSGIDWIRAFDASEFPVRVAAEVEDFDPARVGIVLGSAVGGFVGLLEQADVLRERGLDRVSPFFLPNVLVDSASGQIAISLGIRGPNYAIVSACALVLEELERAQARGATIYAEVAGYGASNDAHHMAQPDPESVGVAEMMRAALARADVDPQQ